MFKNCFLSILTNVLGFNVKDIVVKLMFRDFRMERDARVGGVSRGWMNDVPLHVYEHIVKSFLFIMQDLIASSPNFNAAEFTGEDGYAPFSVAELNDAIGQVYVDFVTNGVTSEKALVWHTTPSSRNRHLGHYHVYQFNRSEVPSIPIPNVPTNARLEAAGSKKGRSFPDSFWSALCSTKEIPGLSCVMTLKSILVGHLLVTNYPGLVGDPNFQLQAPMVKDLYEMNITADHKLKDIGGTWKKFLEFLKNLRKPPKPPLNFQDYPEYIGMTAREKEACLEKVRLCQDFQLEGESGDGVDDVLEERISRVIRSGKLLDIVRVGVSGMNAEYVTFLVNLQERYEVLCQEAWDVEKMKTPCVSSYIQEAKKVAKTLRDENYTIHF
jgi:hypothetical protein